MKHLLATDDEIVRDDPTMAPPPHWPPRTSGAAAPHAAQITEAGRGQSENRPLIA